MKRSKQLLDGSRARYGRAILPGFLFCLSFGAIAVCLVFFIFTIFNI